MQEHGTVLVIRLKIVVKRSSRVLPILMKRETMWSVICSYHTVALASHVDLIESSSISRQTGESMNLPLFNKRFGE